MSKLALIRQYSSSPAAGGFLTFLAPAAKFIGKTLGLVKAAAKTPVGQAIAYGASGAAAGALMAPKGKGKGTGATGEWTRRRSRGITARELRGYRKVARLLHKEGMVSKLARRGRH